ncbi:zinc finger protein 185 isoform X2 [Genypterus blacodes]|uniref:zinc finger protein 185 isoform X2 n=1 Tax=Genypterus blacodes TaxID=154954 RepID=UPI003F763937
MSGEGNRDTVFRTTKVRTKLKGDGSWMLNRTQSEAEPQQEKPWIAEVRARRLSEDQDQATSEISPVSSTVKPTEEPTKPATDRTPKDSGFLIRGVFTRTDSKPATSSTFNGISGTTNYSKKASDTYKKIAPHTVRTTSEIQEVQQLSPEEKEKRTEAASNVLKRSSVKTRSYVLSAAKKYESLDNADAAPVNSSVSFVAKRVEIFDDDESPPAPSATVPEPESQTANNTSAVDEPLAPKVEVAAPEPEKEDAPLVPVEDPFAGMKPGCTKVATPLPELIVELEKEDPSPVPVEEEDPFAGMKPGCTKVDTPLPALIAEFIQDAPRDQEPDDDLLVKPAPESTIQEPLALVSLAPVPAASEPPTLVSPTPEPAALEPLVLVSPAPVPAAFAPPAPVSPTPEFAVQEPEPASSPYISTNVDTLVALSDTLLSFDTSSTSQSEETQVDAFVSASNSFKDDQPSLVEEEASLVLINGGVEHEPTPVLSNCIPITDDLLALTSGPEEPVEPVPQSPGRWSQDLLSELDSNPASTTVSLNLLADDVIPISTEASSLSDAREEEKQTDETVGETLSSTETVTVSTTTVIITDESSVDPFDPYPMRPTSHNSVNTLSSNMDSLVDLNPINTDTKSPSTHSWASSWDPSNSQLLQSKEYEPESSTEDQQTLVRFEKKSSENDSPWDKWTSPTIYTVATTTEEEEEEQRPEVTETETITTITTIRETYGEPEPATDRYETFNRTSREEPAPEAPEPRKNFVYLKEYVSASELASHNARDSSGSGSDYFTSRSSSYSYSSPSTYSSAPVNSSCTYCGETVGNNAKITIEHLNINCHPDCFKCGVCGHPMGDLLDDMFLHGGKVHCGSCYSKALD